MRVVVLGSGSKGNCTLVESDDTAILIDAGFSGKELARRLESVGTDPQAIDGLAITHEHSDHVRGAGVFARRYKIPVHINAGTLLRRKDLFQGSTIINEFKTGVPFRIGNIEMDPFPVCHDCADPVAFRLGTNGFKMAHVTDLGHVTHLVRAKLEGLDCAVIELNHDVGMLLNGPYPWSLKQRIMSRIGHLSNEDGGALIKTMNGITAVFLAHLSHENNDPGLAVAAASLAAEGVGRNNLRIELTSQDRPSESIEF